MASEKLEIAVLGPLGTYTHEAAFQAFGAHASYHERSSIEDVFVALSESDGVSLGVVPHENSIFGSVVETYDRLRATPCFIQGEIALKVEHCLLVREGVKLEQIRRVFSHEQALGQCRGFIGENLPAAKSIKTPSTAAAARALLDEPLDCAAICSSICASLFSGLEIISSNIQDEKANFTQFYVLSSDDSAEPPPIIAKEPQTKALVRLLLPSIPPGLSDNSPSSHNILGFLNKLELPVERISRRPSLDALPFHSVYFVEVYDQDPRGVSTITTDHAESWRSVVNNAISRLKASGGDVELIGIW